MGSLMLPAGGRIFIDADVLIYSVEQIPPFWSVLEPLWAAAAKGEVLIVGSELLVIEALPAPIKQKNTSLAASFNAIFTSSELRLVPVAREILRTGAELRAVFGLRTPDAIHAATAMRESCSMFLTNDAVFRRLPGLPSVILNDIVSQP